MKIFPATIHNGEKIPLISNWKTLATEDQNQIKEWQNTFGERIKLYGIPCGIENDLLVLDVDVKHADKNGFKTIADHNLQIPLTKSQKTPSGGVHYLFNYPKNGKDYPNKVGFMPGLDIRSRGGWIGYYGTDETPIAEAPEWLLNMIGEKPFEQPKGDPIKVAPSISAEVLHSSLENIRNAPDGESNDILNVEAFKVGQLVSAGAITREYAEQALMAAAKERGKPERESRATIQSGLKGGNNKPLTSPFTSELPEMSFPQVPVATRWTPPPMEMADLFNYKHLRKPQLFEDWSTEDISITVADGGTGKTTLKLYESVCLAIGQRFLGFNCVQPGGRTLYLTGEDTEKKLTAMIGQILKGMNLHNDPSVIKTVLDSIRIKKDDSLCLISKDKQNQFLNYNDVALNSMLQAVEDFKPKMIVIDPIASFWGSESAVNDMGKAVSKFVSKLANESGACVEMINHAGKVSSSSKDMSQFAGRGGTGLVSHCRVARVLRPIDGEEYTEITNKSLDESQSAIICNINKFSDGSPLLNKPFIILREGWGISKQTYELSKADQERSDSDTERVYSFISEARKAGKFPTKSVVIGHFMTHPDKMSESRSKRAIDAVMYGGKAKAIENPDVSIGGQVYITVDEKGREII